MKSQFRNTYILKTLGLSIFILIGLVVFTMNIQPFNNFFSKEAIIYYFTCIAGLLAISFIFHDFKVVIISENSISLKPILGKIETIPFTNISGYKTYYYVRSASSTELGYEIKDSYKSVALFLNDNNRIDINGSYYENWSSMLEYIIKKLPGKLAISKD